MPLLTQAEALPGSTLPGPTTSTPPQWAAGYLFSFLNLLSQTRDALSAFMASSILGSKDPFQFAYITGARVASSRSPISIIIDSGSGASLLSTSLARSLKLQVTPYTGPPRSWGPDKPMSVVGVATVPLYPLAGYYKSDWGNEHNLCFILTEVLVVDDYALPRRYPFLLGTKSLHAMNAVLDMGAATLSFKAAHDAPLSSIHPQRTMPLRVTPEPLWDFGNQPFPVFITNETCIKPHQTVMVDCTIPKPAYVRLEDTVSFVPPRFQQGPVSSYTSDGKGGWTKVATNEMHPLHGGLTTPGTPVHLDSKRQWSPHEGLRAIQQLAFRLEISNLGAESIHLRANEVLGITKAVDWKRWEETRHKKVDAEHQWAAALLNGVTPRSSAPSEVESPQFKEARAILTAQHELLAFLSDTATHFDKTRDDWVEETPPQPSTTTTAAAAKSPDTLWPPATFRSEPESDDGLPDVEPFLLPTEMPELAVLTEVLEFLKTLRYERLDLTPRQRLQAIFVLASNIPVFRYILRQWNDLGTAPVPLRIKKDQAPLFIRQWPIPQAKLDAARTMTKELVAQGVISPIQSPWNAPVMMVKKKDGTWRFAVDYRRLNDITEMDPAPVPHLRTSLHQMTGNSWFSVCDMLWSFWQQPLCADDIPKTAFSVEGMGQFGWSVVPMGLKNSPQTQQRAMEGVLAGLDPNHVLCYIDDIIVAGRTFHEHLLYLDLMMRRLQAMGLALKLKKCQFFRRQVHFLGHLLSGNGLTKDPTMINKVLNWPRPKDVTSLRGFINCVGFYRDFIPLFSDVSEPLVALTRKGADVQNGWGESQQTAFLQLKAAMASPQVLALPDFAKPFFVFTDASAVGMGATLSQVDEQGRYRPVLFLSRKWNGAEQNYSATEREALSFITAVTKCRYYLFGRRFTVVTDASALTAIYGHGPLVDNQGIPKQAPRVARWALLLSNYEFDVIHMPGKRMVVADYLSRLADTPGNHEGMESDYANPWVASEWSFARAPPPDAPRAANALATFMEAPVDWNPQYV